MKKNNLFLDLYLFNFEGQSYSTQLNSILKKYNLLNKYSKLKNGKPVLLNSENGISISNSNKTVAILISNSKKIGVDIEHKIGISFDDYLHLMDEAEIKLLSIVNENESKTEFYKLWTIKESYYKISGKTMDISKIYNTTSTSYKFYSFEQDNVIITVVFPILKSRKKVHLSLNNGLHIVI